jgi:putative nucleotidyltransferase with HDIG domain
MKQYDINLIQTELRANLSEKRFTHTEGVIETALQLARHYGEDEAKTYLAALLHDCAKPISTNLGHAGKGAQLAREKYGVADSYILDAIAYHTTGRPNMTLLDKIIFIADYIEPNRQEAPNLDDLRRLAFVDLDKCLRCILKATLEYLKGKNVDIDPMTEQTYQYYLKMNQKKE